MFPVTKLGVPPCWRAYFLLLRQKKVAKEKATPGYAVGYADSPALLVAGGGCGTRACGPQTVLALFPPAPALLGAPHGARRNIRHQAGTEKSNCCGQPEKTPKNEIHRFSPDALPGPLRGAEQRRNVGGVRRALFEGRSPELRSRPAFRVAQGTGQRPAPTQGWPFLWLLSFGHTKESTPASKAEHQANQNSQAYS
jgi:hypothetical protein